MADRLSQLQDAVNQQAENLCNSIGILFQTATPVSFPGFDKSSKTPSQTENLELYHKTFAKLIARNGKDIDILIDSLPSEESSAEVQTASMKDLEKEGEEAAARLQRGVERGQKILDDINRALADIANTQLAINRITEASQGDLIKI
ncbi:UNVERIFIED_CONTAM: hypothetical protein RMT77_006388 [Armadillidium vulgare]|nr:Mediator of RNA polymerase II transcription subunit 21 [Armadillidium vulgare]